MKKMLPIFLTAAVATVALASDPITVAPQFGSCAVLQRDVKLPIWGTAEPGARITATIFPHLPEGVAIDADLPFVQANVDEDGKWRMELPAQPASEQPCYIEFRCVDSELSVTNILFGDVWLCSGQSNMDMNYNWGLTRGKEDIETANDPLMRLLDDGNALSIDPLDAFKRPPVWTGSGFANARNFSACGWFFGQALRKAMPGVPIGLIEASWSGSPIRTWLSAEAYCGADPACSNEYMSATKAIREFIDSGKRDEYQKRMELWTAECAARGDIAAEGSDFDDSAWEKVALPVTFEKQFDNSFDGCVWYRREFEASAAMATSETTLSLGPIDDNDKVWVNGQLVGSGNVWDKPRIYKVPAGVIREGRNVIAIKAVDLGGVGGLTGKPEALSLAVGETKMPLAGEWRTMGFAFDPKPKSVDVSSWTPTACYNAMIHPLFPMAIKGAIWYQGCSDVGNEKIYDKVFRAMAADWRAHFTHPDGMPIYLVQLAAFKDTHAETIDSSWAAMRFTQMKIGATLEKSGTAVAIDIGHHTDIHPKDKKTVGERLARLALVRTYGVKDLVEAGPMPRAAIVKDGKVVISFNNAIGLKTSDGGPLKGFQLKVKDADYAWCDAAIDGETVVIAVPEGAEPEAVRYAWDDYPVCNLVNGEGLPSGPFAVSPWPSNVKMELRK